MDSVLSLQSLSSNGQAVWAALLWGLTTSLHCLGMCGGFALSDKAREIARSQSRWKASISYHAGRFLTYTSAGIICGWVGQGLALSPHLQVAVPLVGGVFLLFWGFQGSGLVPSLRQFKLPRPKFLDQVALRGDWGPFSIGGLSVLLPCAPLQIALVFAAGNADPVRGGLAMAFFWVGTVPLLALVQAVATFVSGKTLRLANQISSLVVLFMGVALIGRGLILAGYVLPSPTKSSGITIQAKVAGAIQDLRTEVTRGQIPSIEVRRGVPVVWTIHANLDQLDGCTSTLMSREFGFRIRLTSGNNTLSFTPGRTGVFGYSSWCGMLHNSIRVTD